MKRFWLSVPIAMGLSLLYTGIAYAQDGTPPTDVVQTGEIAAKLVGLVAAATLIERIIEMIWDFYENNILVASKLAKNTQSYLYWVQKQFNDAKNKLIAEPAKDSEISDLEDAFQKAEQRLTEYLKSAVYISMKKKVSVPASMILGLFIAFVTELQMFYLLGILGPNTSFKIFDIFITGLIIGTGSAPVHSLIGILQNTKDVVDSARALYTGKAISEVTDAIKELDRRKVTTVDDIKKMTNIMRDTSEDKLINSGTPLTHDKVELERRVRRLIRL